MFRRTARSTIGRLRVRSVGEWSAFLFLRRASWPSCKSMARPFRRGTTKCERWIGGWSSTLHWMADFRFRLTMHLRTPRPVSSCRRSRLQALSYWTCPPSPFRKMKPDRRVTPFHNESDGKAGCDPVCWRARRSMQCLVWSGCCWQASILVGDGDTCLGFSSAFY